MYSKAGKAANEFFTILQHTQEILDPKTRRFKSTFNSHGANTGDKLADMSAKKFGQNAIMKDLAGILDVDDLTVRADSTSKSPTKYAKEAKKTQPFSMTVSRDDREKVLSYKVVSSNAAYCEPKYERVEKKAPNMVDYSKTSSKRLFDEIISSSVDNSPTHQLDPDSPAIYDKPRGKVKGAIPLGLQVSRPDVLEEAQKHKICITDTLSSPDMPSVLSSAQRLPRIKFSRNLPRKDITIETAASGCPIYDANHEFVKKSLGHVGAQLDKVTGRKDPIKSSYYTSGTVYDYDEYVGKNKSNVYPKVNHPTFEKMPLKEKDPQSKIPAYLQSLHSRLGEPVVAKTNDSTINRNDSMMFASPRNVDTTMLNSSSLHPRI